MVIAYSYVDIEYQQLMQMLKENINQNTFDQEVDREKEMQDILNVFS